jgi:hypothetical protein
LEAVLAAATRSGLPVVSMSTHDATWIENLMAQLGVEIHFRRFPKYDDISLVISQFKKPVFEQLTNVGT